jgi:hypothetical protein
MDNVEFDLLKIKASVCPSAETWPKPDFSKVSISGDKPHMEVGDPHWCALHDAVSTARSHVLKAFGSMAAIDEDRNLSPTGKAEKKKEIASKALAALEKAPHLSKARSAVEDQVKRWDKGRSRPKASAMPWCSVRFARTLLR